MDSGVLQIVRLPSVNTMDHLSRNVTKRPSNEINIQEETFPAAEKILSDIENVMKKDPELVSFEIIPVQDNENKSPVYHEEHSLGLASWCVQPLYCYAYARLLDLRRSDHRREEPSTIARWLTGALLLNPDISTFWNMKRELVGNGRLDALGELRFSTIVLYHKAKCLEAFAYRRWLLRHLLCRRVGDNKTPEVETMLRNEINVAGVSADRYANNYHAWSHREYVIASCEKILSESYETLIKSEWENSGKWCARHVSDHSGLAYRQFLLNRLLYERTTDESSSSTSRKQLTERREFVDRLIASRVPNEPTDSPTINGDSWELLNILHGTKSPRLPDVDYDRVLVALSYWAEDCGKNDNDILAYPGHEALWYHRRFLGNALVTLQNSYKRHSRYRLDDLPVNRHTGHPRSDRDYRDDRDDGKTNERTRDRDNTETGLLSILFHKNNERIVKISQISMQEPQKTLGEKFLKYTKEFNSDASNDEGR